MSSAPTHVPDVLVVGAGIIGSGLAHRLALDGRSVAVVDSGRHAGAGSTSASSGIVRFHYESFDNAALAWESHGAWLDWMSEVDDADGPQPRYTRTGALLLGRDVVAFAGMTENFRRLGVPHEVMTPARLSDRFPGLDIGRYGPPARPEDERFWADSKGELSGLYTQSGGYVSDPECAAASYARAASRLGVRFHWATTVRELAVANGRVTGVRTTDGQLLRARVVVNAAGAGSSVLNRMAGLASTPMVRTRPLRVETHAVAAPASFVGAEAAIVLDPDLGIAFRPDGTGDLHLSSLEPACDPLWWTHEVEVEDPRPTRDYFDLQVLRLARRLPEMGVARRMRGLAALYDVSADWNPLLGGTPLRGFLVACGTSGNSFKTAPAVAHVMSRIVAAHLDGEAEPELVKLPRTGTVVSLLAYRPLRTAHRSSSVIG